MRLAWRFLVRDWRAGELNVLLLALVLAVTSITSVGFFADRVRQALDRDAHELLGGDLLIVGDQPLPRSFGREARALGLRTAKGLDFISMARAGTTAQLSAVKAVGPPYPLLGSLTIARGTEQAQETVRHGPPRGSVWVDPRFVDLTGVRPGQTIALGDTRLKVDAVLIRESDRGLSFFDIAPRVMMNLDDLPATGLVQPGSRITYRLHLAGDAPAIRAYRAWLQPRLARGQRLEDLGHARPRVRAALDRAQRFLGLAALLSVVLAAVALRLATGRYVERHLDGYAVMRCLGATQARLGRLFGVQFLLLGTLGGLAGCALGYLAQGILGGLVAGIVHGRLPLPSPLPALQGLATGYLMLLGFAVPLLLQLQKVPALHVIRRETGAPGGGTLLAYGAALAALAGLLIWQARDLRLALYLLGGFLAALAIYAVVGLIALRLASGLGRYLGPAGRHGLRNLRRHGWQNLAQLVALGLALTAILLLGFTRNDLLAGWRARIPPDAPNRFIINIQPEQRQAVRDFFRDAGLSVPTLYPMVRGRLIAINGRPVQSRDYPDARSRHLAERAFNLSYMTRMPAYDGLAAGHWFTRPELDTGALSVEAGIAKTLGIRLGDRLTWSVAGTSFSAPVTSLRHVDWDSMQVNFFVIATPGLIRSFPTSYITSFHLAGDEAGSMTQLVRHLPNLTVVDTTSILAQVLSLMDKLVAAVQFVFLFSLVAGVLVLYGALLASRDARVREAALLRSLGATRAQVTAAQRVEFAVLGLLAGLLAAAGAVAIGAVLALRVFEFGYTPNPWIWVAGPLLGLACATLNAWAGSRAALNAAPLLVLRED